MSQQTLDNTMSEQIVDGKYLKHSPFMPYDPHCSTVVMSEGGQLASFAKGGFGPYEYTGWEDETLSWHDNAFIHAGLNPTTMYRLKGPDALKLLSDVSVNSFKYWEEHPQETIGRSKHAIMCDENGKIIIHGMVQRTGEDEFLTYWLWPYLGFVIDKGGYDVVGENITGDRFLFQIGGPRSLEIIEAASQEDHHDLRFLRFEDGTIAGKDVSIWRIGMCGTLAYEVHGRTEDALDVYRAIIDAGEEFGIRRLGKNGYRVVHTEGGFPQIFYHFPFAIPEGFFEYVMTQDLYGFAAPVLSGSADPDPSQLVRSPLEVGWGNMIKFDHDFIGRAALEREVANPVRTMVTLEWNHEDLLGLVQAQFDPENKVASLPWSQDWDFYNGSNNAHTDKVVDDTGKSIGLSSGRMFSPHYKEMISLCTIDVEHAKLGTEVNVVWGEHGQPTKNIRATVARFPYIDENRNENVDTSTIPRLK